MRIRYKRSVSGKMIYQFTDYSSFELHFRGSDYQIRKDNKIVKYLDGANGHETCLEDAYKYIRQRTMKNNNEETIEIPMLYHIDEKTGEKIYDLEEMANEFENKLSKLTQSTVMCSILED